MKRVQSRVTSIFLWIHAVENRPFLLLFCEINLFNSRYYVPTRDRETVSRIAEPSMAIESSLGTLFRWLHFKD